MASVLTEASVQLPSDQLPSDQDASGRTLGIEELELLGEVIRSGVLTSTKGKWVKDFESEFARSLPVRFAHASSSGTAAIHAAVAALNPEPGEEIITSSITDMGALTPLLYQGAIPVFADVDARTYNITASSIEARWSERTRAILVTHLFGNPCDMTPILELAERRGVPVIEDCAQAFGASSDGRPCGTMGAIGCFSLQQGKHITTGEGGIVVTNDEQLARRVFLFINKAWGYGDPEPDHYFLALNYRMSELQGAVARAQLPKLDGVAQRRIRGGKALGKKLAGLRGIGTPPVAPHAVHSYWKYPLDVDPEVIPGGTGALARELKAFLIPSAPRYIQKPAFQCRIFRDQQTLGTSRFPFNLARPEALDYSPERFPETLKALSRVLVLPWNENYEEAHIDHIAESIHDAVARLRR